MKLSIIVPVLNEAPTLFTFLQHLQPLRQAGHQLIVVDGGSCDNSTCIAETLSDLVLISEPGRARQMNAGAEQAEGDWLLFLHADTWLPLPLHEWCEQLAVSQRVWGRFDVRLSGKQLCFRVIEKCINWRSALTGIATGDQGMFVRRDQFEKLAGFPRQPLMEDVELSSRLRRVSSPLCLKQAALTSSRRWEKGGVVRTVWLMWTLRFRYFWGASPFELVERYYPSKGGAKR